MPSSPYINRFIQSDTIIPNLANPQSLNRYSYVLNNPILFNDPTGHDAYSTCGGNTSCMSYVNQHTDLIDTNVYKANDLKKKIKKQFNWDIKGNNWSLTEVQAIYQTGVDIENYVNGLTSGNGNAWMLRNLGNTTFVHASWGDAHARTLPNNLWGGSTISLGKTWLNNSIWKPNEHIAHELGHVWDIHTILAASADLIQNIGGGEVCYLCKPENAPQWDPHIHNTGSGAYGNTGRNDYFAEAFSVTIYSPGDAPSGVSTWIDANISSPAFASILTLDPSDPVP